MCRCMLQIHDGHHGNSWILIDPHGSLFFMGGPQSQYVGNHRSKATPHLPVHLMHWEVGGSLGLMIIDILN